MTTPADILFWIGLTSIVIGCWFIVAENRGAIGQFFVTFAVSIWVVEYALESAIK